MARKCMLTTYDNPYDPFDNYSEWYLYDIQKGYNSCAYLARIAFTADQLTDEENDIEVERAIDEIVMYNPLLYKKVVREEQKFCINFKS